MKTERFIILETFNYSSSDDENISYFGNPKSPKFTLTRLSRVVGVLRQLALSCIELCCKKTLCGLLWIRRSMWQHKELVPEQIIKLDVS